MEQKELQCIYEYMGWYKTNRARNEKNPYANWIWPVLDSNTAWECVQEMERKGDSLSFSKHSYDVFMNAPANVTNYFLWLYNPTNFFDCFGKWLERRGKESGKLGRVAVEESESDDDDDRPEASIEALHVPDKNLLR